MEINRKIVGISNRGEYRGKRAQATLRSLSSPTGVIVEYHVLRALEEQGFDLCIQRDNKSRYEPEKLFDALSKYGKPVSLNVNESVLLQAFKLTLSAFGGHKSLLPLEEKESLFDAIKLEKSSGAPMFTSKREAFESDYQRMLRFSRGERAADPCVAYHRIQHGADGPKTRLVWGYPLHMTLLEAKYARPLIDYFLRNRTPMAFGLHRHELSARLVPITNMGIRYGFDFSGYDSTLHPRLIDMAFMVLRTHFEYVDEREWRRMVHYFIHTPILMPDSYVYVVNKGVPSGSYFTQLVDSILNYLANQYASIRLLNKPIESEKILVLGDDVVFGIDKHLPLQRWGVVFSELGLALNGVKSKVTRYGQGVNFLGHTWDRGLVNRELEEIAKRMAFPEKPIKIEDARLRIVSRILAYGSDGLNAHLIICSWSRYKGPDIRGIYLRDTLTEPLTGWREIISGDRELRFPTNALDQIFVGILT